MATEKHKTLIKWLKDAYVMENKIVEVLEKHSEDAKDYPDVKEKIKEHANVSKEHAEKVKHCLESLSESIPNLMAQASKIVGAVEGMFSDLKEDKIIKNSIIEFATENMEIASYSAIAVAANECNENGIADICLEIISEEEEMSIWIENNLEALITKVLNMKSE